MNEHGLVLDHALDDGKIVSVARVDGVDGDKYLVLRLQLVSQAPVLLVDSHRVVVMLGGRHAIELVGLHLLPELVVRVLTEGQIVVLP